MKKHILSLMLLILPAFTLVVNAQKEMQEGYIKMEITDISSENENMMSQLSMMKGTETEVYFTKDQYMTKMSIMGGMMTTQTFIGHENKKMDMLLNMMGKKIWVDSNLDESQKSGGRSDIASSAKVEYDKTKTKEILGYKAYHMTITSPDMEGMIVTGYVTEAITSSPNIIQGMESLKLQGFPLEFKVTSPDFSMTFAAKEVKNTVDKSVFNLKTEGYEKMTLEEFSKSMGGMGMGF